MQWREVEDLPPAGQLIVSPYDTHARTGNKRDKRWVGYKVHVTETCDEDAPHLITHVETTSATATDEAALEPIHQALQQRELLPAEHLVDAGYVDGARLVASKEQYQVRLVGPLPDDNSWQTQADKGYGPHCFLVDWEAHKVTCPAGQQSKVWAPTHTAWGKEAIHVQFASSTCRVCVVREECTKSARGGRGLTLRPQAEHVAMLAQKAEQQSTQFKEEYKRRAGVEGTLSQGVRVGGLRQSRYIGRVKTALQHILIAVGINLLRMVEWLEERPRARTRITAFARLASRQRFQPIVMPASP